MPSRAHYERYGRMQSSQISRSGAADDPDLAAAMWRCEGTGRPLGERTFLGKLEGLLGRSLLPRKPGRDRKERK